MQFMLRSVLLFVYKLLRFIFFFIHSGCCAISTSQVGVPLPWCNQFCQVMKYKYFIILIMQIFGVFIRHWSNYRSAYFYFQFLHFYAIFCTFYLHFKNSLVTLISCSFVLLKRNAKKIFPKIFVLTGQNLTAI